MEDGRDNRFLKGLICGVLLTLGCMAMWAGIYRIRLNKRLQEWQTSPQPVTEAQAGQDGADGADQSERETTEELALDAVTVSEKIEEIQDIINSKYRGDIDPAQVEEYIYVGLVAGLGDPYSEYFPKQEKQFFDEDNKGVYSGIGATFEQDVESGKITVASCFAGSAADRAGLLAGDEIRAVNGQSVEGMSLDDLVEDVRTSLEESVEIELLRGSETVNVTVEIEQVEIPTAENRMLGDGIGYLQITEFDDVTVEQVKEALTDLQSQGMEKLVVDLRDNPGGILQDVCAVLNYFLPEGLIVYMENKHGERTEYFADGDPLFEGPLAVLVNGSSASAAEVFAGAVKDRGIGTLVGTTTYGKGVAQTMYNLADGSALKLTTDKYFTPNGNDINEKGIEPDVEVPAADGNGEEDPQLQEAVRILEES